MVLEGSDPLFQELSVDPATAQMVQLLVDGLLKRHRDRIREEISQEGGVMHHTSAQKEEIPVMKFFQDESIFNAHDGARKAWLPPGYSPKLHKKGAGPGVMISGYSNEQIGLLAFPAARYDDVNILRVLRGRPPIKYFTEYKSEYHAFHEFDYGKNKEGYWNAEKNQVMALEVLDVFDFIWNQQRDGAANVLDFKRVARLIYDHSSGHAKFPEHALNVHHMNLKAGGAGAPIDNAMQDMEVLGSYPASNYVVRLKPGESKEEKEGWVGVLEDGVKYRTLRKGDKYPTVFQEEDAPPTFKPTLKDYVGKHKGMRQIAWELGRVNDECKVEMDGEWVKASKDGMQKSDELGRTYYDRRSSFKWLIKELPEFRAQKSELMLAIEGLGHQCDFWPKFHCELNPRSEQSAPLWPPVIL